MSKNNGGSSSEISKRSEFNINSDAALSMKSDATDINEEDAFPPTTIDHFPTRGFSLGTVEYSWKNLNAFCRRGRKLGCINVNIKPGKECSIKCGNAKPKQILKNVNGYIRSGQLLAIVGPNGSGRTTLLNILSFYDHGSLDITGDLCLNHILVGPNVIPSLSSYIHGESSFISTATVKEVLQFQIALRCPACPKADRDERIVSILNEFDLIHLGASRVGSLTPLELKRLGFAAQIVTAPMFLFCDEPTLGICGMEQTVLMKMKDLATRGGSVVCSVDPTSSILNQFDIYLFLSEGRQLYYGGMQDAMAFFSRHGLSYPSTASSEGVNSPSPEGSSSTSGPPMKQLTDVKIDDISEKFETSDEFKEMIKHTGCRDEGIRFVSTDPEETTRNEKKALRDLHPFVATRTNQFISLVKRSALVLFRDPAFRLQILGKMLVSFIIGLFFLGHGSYATKQEEVNKCLFLLLFAVAVDNICGHLPSIREQLVVYQRETMSRMYKTYLFYIAKLTIEIPLCIFHNLIITLIVYSMINVSNLTIEMFMGAFTILIFFSNTCSSFGCILTYISQSSKASTILLIPIILPFVLLGNFFRNFNDTHWYFYWLKYLSWFSFAYEGLIINQWTGRTLLNDSASNSTISGDEIVKSYKLHSTYFGWKVLGSFFWALFYQLVCFSCRLSTRMKP